MAGEDAVDGGRTYDWEGIERSPEFQELVKKKRSFVIPGTIFFLAWYMIFICLCAFAADFMGERVYEGLTVGYVLALTQFLMVFVLGLMYLSRSKNVFDPLATKAIERYADPEDSRAGGADHRAGTDGRADERTAGAVAPRQGATR